MTGWRFRALRLGMLALGCLALFSAGPGRSVAADGEWPAYGRDVAGTRFAPLTEITPDNVNGLKRAWVYHVDQGKENVGGLETTPLMVGDSLYLCSSDNQVIALDAETGQERWRYDPKPTYTKLHKCRGVAYFHVEGSDGPCAERILSATQDAHLFAVDAKTGALCPDFGQGGVVNLEEGIGDNPRGYYVVTSAPTIVRGKVIVGGWISDSQEVGEPSGVVRAYDAVTGAMAWAWDLGRPDDHGLPPEGQTYTRGTPNAWAPMSGDDALGLVYLPMGNATPDYWGAFRKPEWEKYASSVVALDVETGEVRWSFQTAHHDIWDYDIASQPTLIDFPVEQGTVPAVVVATKSGQLYVLDRRTGTPLTAVKEKPVPQGPAKGDWLSPTQPVSTGMPSFGTGPLTDKDMWGLTPFDHLWCQIAFHKLRYQGLFTPPSTRGTVVFPGIWGGFNWGGLSVDPARHLLILNWNRLPTIVRLIPRAEANKEGVVPVDIGEGHGSGIGAQKGTPFAAELMPFLSPLRVPCVSPPLGLISVVDLKSRKVVWTHRLGTARDSGPLGLGFPLALPMGVPNLGGSVTTGSGLVFIGATVERAIRAIDLKSGKVLWKDRLPAGGYATPMTYISPKSGRQFVVIAAGGNFALGGPLGDSIVAYALPAKP